MDGVACEFEVAGIVSSRVSTVRKERVHAAARMDAGESVALRACGVARACARPASAPEQRNEIAIDSSGCAPRACAGAGCARWATEITINSSGFSPRACAELAMHEAQGRGDGFTQLKRVVPAAGLTGRCS
jgi:hypothetical protein